MALGNIYIGLESSQEWDSEDQNVLLNIPHERPNYTAVALRSVPQSNCG